MTASLGEWRTQGASLAPRAARHSKASALHRLTQLRHRSFFIVQCALAAAAAARHPSLSADVIRAQVRSAVVDLLMLTGLTYHEARAQVPASSDALERDFEEGGS